MNTQEISNICKTGGTITAKTLLTTIEMRCQEDGPYETVRVFVNGGYTGEVEPARAAEILSDSDYEIKVI